VHNTWPTTFHARPTPKNAIHAAYTDEAFFMVFMQKYENLKSNARGPYASPSFIVMYSLVYLTTFCQLQWLHTVQYHVTFQWGDPAPEQISCTVLTTQLNHMVPVQDWGGDPPSNKHKSAGSRLGCTVLTVTAICNKFTFYTASWPVRQYYIKLLCSARNMTINPQIFGISGLKYTRLWNVFTPNSWAKRYKNFTLD
jgi:hypothetical protein